MAGSVQTEIDDIAAELKVVLKPLAPLGFPVADWIYSALTNRNWRSSTIKNFIENMNMFNTIKNFIENMKMFNRIQDEVVRDDWLALGIKKGFSTEITSCTFYEMYNFTRFIQSNDGIKLLDDLAKKRSQTHKPYLSLFNLQLSGLAIAKKCKRAELEDEIAELRRHLAQQQMELEKKQLELEKKVADVDALFLPCAQYQPLDEVTLLKRCYDKYLAEQATEQGMEVLELEQDLLETLKVKFGVVVHQEHLYEFMRDEDRRKAIKVWANEKILELGEQKEASFVHRLLADT